MILDIPPDKPADVPTPLTQDKQFYAKRTFLSITELAAFARCPRRYFYSAGCGFRKTGDELTRRNDAAHFGVSLGNAIPIALATGSYEKAYAEFLKVWGDRPGDDKRNPLTAKLLIAQFMATHPGPGLGLYSIKKPEKSNLTPREMKSEWEVPFAIPIPGLPIPLAGSIDYLCTWHSDRREWVVECKTSAEMSQRFYLGFKRNPQGLAYTLARRTAGVDCAGYVMELFGTAKTKTTLQTVPVMVSDHELEDFIKWVQVMGQMILECEKSGNWPKQMTGCGTYPMFYQPGYYCEFDPMCSVPDWRTMTQFYNVERHEPYVLVTNEGKQIVGLHEGPKEDD